MDDSSGVLAVILILTLISALLTLAYSALKNSRPAQLEEQVEAGSHRANRALRLLDADTHLDISYVLALNILRFAVAGLIMLFLLSGVYPVSPPMALLILILCSALLAIPSDLVPEGVGSRYSDSLALTLLPILQIMVLVLTPLTLFVLGLSYLFARLSGSEGYVNTVTEEEIMTLVNASYTGGEIEDEEQRMIYSILRLDNSTAREIMTPRIDVVGLDVNATREDALATFVETGFSRIPVYEENIDNIIGLLYAKDLLKSWQEQVNGGGKPVIRNLLRTVHYIPEDRPADKVLVRMRDQKIHMAIVEDTYGGTSGIITIEDLIEEIIGDIQDEHDPDEPLEYRQLEDDIYLVDAAMDLDDLNTLMETHFDTDATATLGGFIFMSLGHVPEVGEVLETHEVRLEVQSLDGRRIRQVHLTRLRDGEESDEDSSHSVDEQSDAIIVETEQPDTPPSAMHNPMDVS